MAKSAMEILRSGDQIEIEFGNYSMEVTSGHAFVNGCDCSAEMHLDAAKRARDALDAFIRIAAKSGE